MTAPSKIGRYEIIRPLGKSMTDVYLAVDTVENRKTALKVIQSGGDQTNRMVVEAERRGAAIQREMQALDPRVVEIYEVGDENGFFFVAMEFVEGRSLAEVLRTERTMDPARAATIALELCEQLAKFHSWDPAVVHGDIKPSNVHLGPSDTVRLLDFGIAKTLRTGAESTGHEFGSPGYCSPERLTRSQVDPQSDLWAVGATLYEMLAGSPPYQAENTRKLEEVIRSKRPPRALPPGLPRGLRAITSKALSPEPRHRYASARDFQDDLQTFLEHRVTKAEKEQRITLAGNATIEAAKEALRRATVTMRRAKRRLQMLGAVGWFATGMALWIAGTLGWQAWQWRQARRKPAPAAAAPTVDSPKLYIAAADQIFDSYARSAEASLAAFDWQKAEVCLLRAVELGATDDATLGRLALSRGYATLERLSDGRYSEAAAAHLRRYARDEFVTATVKTPADPRPHLALARLYLYTLADPNQALAEFDSAERLGAVLGGREIDQRADAVQMREEQLAARAAEERELKAAKARTGARRSTKTGRTRRWR